MSKVAADRERTEGVSSSMLHDLIGQAVTLRGWVHGRRDLGKVQFLLLRDRDGVVQCVLSGADLPLPESSVEVEGTVVANSRAPHGLEVQASALRVVSQASAATPVEVPKEEWHANPETLLHYRYASVRGSKAQAILKVKAQLVAAFREFLASEGFTEIFTPKLVSAGAEGGANQFELEFYGERAYLTQSPQLYKQMMIPVFERVFEVAPVYRAEKSHTTRHLAEYLSMDVEMGFIEGVEDVLAMQERTVKAMVDGVARSCGRQLELLGANAPDTSVPIPRIPLLEARELVKDRYGHASGGKDLDPEAERLLGRWASEEFGSDFVFVTDYPQAARPFYTYPTGDGLTRGVDLLFRGVEITSGGQRIHEYGMLMSELERRGLDPSSFGGYVEAFRHGMPPHGGFAIGAERFTALLLGVPNVRFARSFPRYEGHLQP